MPVAEKREHAGRSRGVDYARIGAAEHDKRARRRVLLDEGVKGLGLEQLQLISTQPVNRQGLLGAAMLRSKVPIVVVHFLPIFIHYHLVGCPHHDILCPRI